MNISSLLKNFYTSLEADSISEAWHHLRTLQQEIPHHPSTSNASGRWLEKQGNYSAARKHYLQAYQQNPSEPETINNLAGVHLNLKEYSQALEWLDKLNRIHPSALSYYNTAQIHATLQEWEQALQSLEQAFVLDPPTNDLFFLYVANQAQQLEHALQILQHLPYLPSQCPHIWWWQALLHQRLNQPEKALSNLQVAAEHSLDPNIWRQLSCWLAQQERLEEAIFWQEKVWWVTQSAEDLARLLRTYPTAIAASDQDIEEQRKRLRELLHRANDYVFPIQDAPQNSAKFYLSYHGHNNRELAIQWSTWEKQMIPAYHHASLHPRKNKRVAWVSAFFREHSITRCFSNSLIHMAHNPELEIGIFSLMQKRNVDLWQDSASQALQQQIPAWQMLYEEEGFKNACQKLLAWEPDIIIYPDVGMHPWSDWLAQQRLAPIQWVLPGHPMTTGISTLDGFITFNDTEHPDAAQHYSEPLIRLPGTFDYSFPQIPWPLQSRSRLGLPSDQHIYFCPMTPFKIHPGFDHILGALLAEDPKAEIWLLQYRHPEFTRRLQQRFQKTLASNHYHRIRFIPWLDKQAFFSLLFHADACLETTHFGGGNTTYQAASVGAPMIIYPGKNLASRLSWGIYQHIGFEATLASSEEEYVQIALQMANNKHHAANIKRMLYHKRHALFNNQQWSQSLLELCLSTTKR